MLLSDLRGNLIMLKRISLRTKLMVAITALVAFAMLGGGTTIWMVHPMDSAVWSVIRSRVAALDVSQEMESACRAQLLSLK